MPDDDEDVTHVECPKCSDDPRTAPDARCDLCHGRGSVRAEDAAFWRAGKLARGSGLHRIKLPPGGSSE